MKHMILTVIFVLTLAGAADACQLDGRYLFVLAGSDLTRTAGEITFSPPVGGAGGWSAHAASLTGIVNARGQYTINTGCGVVFSIEGRPDVFVWGEVGAEHFVLQAGLFNPARIGFGFRLP